MDKLDDIEKEACRRRMYVRGAGPQKGEAVAAWIIKDLQGSCS